MNLTSSIYKSIIFLLLLFVLSGCMTTPNKTLTAEQGEFNGAEIKFNKIYNLDGEWEFYWETLASPNELQNIKQGAISMPVPYNWNQFNKEEFPGIGYATYHATIKNVIPGDYAVRIPNISTSYKLWVNGKLLGENGIVTEKLESTVASLRPREFFITTKVDEVDIVLQVANAAFRDGGIFSSIEFGPYEQVMQKTRERIIFDTILFGIVFLAGLYHLVLYLLRRTDKIALYFGLFCIIISIRVGIVGEKFLLRIFPEISYDFSLQLEYLAFYTCLPLFMWFIYALFPTIVSKLIANVATYLSLCFIAFTFVTKPFLFSKIVFFYEILTIFVIFYLIYVVGKAVKMKIEGAIIVTVCGLFFAMTVINDILFYNSIIDTMEVAALGLFVFIFSQSYIIAKKFSYAFLSVEHISNQLAILNGQLEEKVNERTRSLEAYQQQLEDANNKLYTLSYFDATTDVPNKRYLLEHLDETWKHTLKSKNHISLLFIDIDCFKEFNDTYGHIQGDKTLKQVALKLDEVLRSHSGFLARYGGEEFVALLPMKNSEEATWIAEKCRVAIENMKIDHLKSSVSNHLTVSVGINSEVPNEELSKEKFIFKADQALYTAKTNGRNQVYNYQEKALS